MPDKVTEALVQGLKQAAAAGGEQRLFRSGRFSGIFRSRAGAGGEAATRAVRDGLLEVVRNEARGKTIVEWVRLTPAGLEFLHTQESPLAALQELQAALRMSREGVPVWMAQIREELDTLAARLNEEVQRISRRLEVLTQCVTEALRRAAAAAPQLPAETTAAVPWGPQAVDYLHKRREGGAAVECSLPELFAAVHPQHPQLTIKEFHAGLRRLADRGILKLLPPTDDQPLPEPEYAFLDGTKTSYYAAL
jgi:hypothetical protein